MKNGSRRVYYDHEPAYLKIHAKGGHGWNLGGFGSKAMDLVVVYHVLHCIIGAQDLLAFLRAVYRVLKPGGILFSETMSCEGGFDAVAMDADPATRIARSHTRYWVG